MASHLYPYHHINLTAKMPEADKSPMALCVLCVSSEAGDEFFIRAALYKNYKTKKTADPLLSKQIGCFNCQSMLCFAEF